MRIDSTITAITQAEPISASEFRTYARAVNIIGEDSLVERQLSAAVRYIEKYIGKSINTNTFQSVYWDIDDDLDLDNGDLDWQLTGFPVQSITSVHGYDKNNSETELTADSDYYLLKGSRLRIPNASAYDTYKVVYISGMQSVEITDNIKEAILKITAELYQNRGISVTGTIVSNLKSDLHSLLSGERAKLFL